MALGRARELERRLAVKALPAERHRCCDSGDHAGRARAKAARERDGREDRDVQRHRVHAEPAAGVEVALPDEVVLAAEALLAAVDLEHL